MYQVEIQTYQNGNSDWTVAHSPYTDDARRLYDGKLTLVHDGIPDFEFSLLYGHPLFDDIQPMRSRVKVYDYLTQKVLFVGRVLDPVNKMDSSGVIYRSFVAEGELGLLCDTMQRHRAFVESSPKEYLQEIIRNHRWNSVNSVPDKDFTVNQVDMTDPDAVVYRHIPHKSSYECVMEELVERLGGQLTIEYRNVEDKRLLNYKQVPESGGNITIELAKNLLAIEEKQKPSQLITRLIPLGAEYESYQDAIMVLINAGIIHEDFNIWWVQQAMKGTVKWLGQLLINLSKLSFTGSNTEITTAAQAIEFLGEAGAINTPGYWTQNLTTDPSLRDQLPALLIKCAQKCNTDAQKPKGGTEIKRRLTIAKNSGDPDYVDDEGLVRQYGIIEGTIVWNDVTDADQLRSLGLAWLRNQKLYSSITLTAVELSEAGETLNRFEVGKTYPARHVPLGIDKTYQVTQKVINVLESNDSTLTFGNTDARITSIR